MSKIRVLIRGAPNMLRDILDQLISNEPDMEVISESPLPAPAPAAQALPPDVVVVGVADSEPGESARVLLDRWPRSHALMITARGHRVLMYELLPQRVDLGEISPVQLVETIRSAVRPGRTPYMH